VVLERGPQLNLEPLTTLTLFHTFLIYLFYTQENQQIYPYGGFTRVHAYFGYSDLACLSLSWIRTSVNWGPWQPNTCQFFGSFTLKCEMRTTARLLGECFPVKTQERTGSALPRNVNIPVKQALASPGILLCLI